MASSTWTAPRSPPGSAPWPASRSANSTWRWTATPSWRSISAKGFPNATFEWSSTPAAEPHQLDLRYEHSGRAPAVRAPGARQRQPQHTRPDLIDRNLTLNPGDPLSPTEITDTQRRLYDLGVFSRVDAAIQDPDGDTDSKYVLYDLEEARRYSVAVGFGAEFGRIGGCDDVPRRARRRHRLLPARLLRRHAQQPVGHGPQHQPAHPRFHAGQTRRCSITPGRISPGATTSPSPSPACSTTRADIRTFNYTPRGGLRAVEPAPHQSHHPVLPLRLPARGGERS